MHLFVAGFLGNAVVTWAQADSCLVNAVSTKRAAFNFLAHRRCRWLARNVWTKQRVRESLHHLAGLRYQNSVMSVSDFMLQDLYVREALSLPPSVRSYSGWLNPTKSFRKIQWALSGHRLWRRPRCPWRGVKTYLSLSSTKLPVATPGNKWQMSFVILIFEWHLPERQSHSKSWRPIKAKWDII